MLNDVLLVAAAIVDGAAGVFVGYTIGKSQPADPEVTVNMMNRVVNLEEHEEREKINKVRMAQSNRKTFRNDSGPNAKLMRMRIRRTKRIRR